MAVAAGVQPELLEFVRSCGMPTTLQSELDAAVQTLQAIPCCVRPLHASVVPSWFQANGITDTNALVGVEASDMEWGQLKAGTRGLVRTALKKANGLLAAAVVDGRAPPVAAGESGAIRALVEAVTKQQAIVKVALAPRIKDRQFSCTASRFALWPSPGDMPA